MIKFIEFTKLEQAALKILCAIWSGVESQKVSLNSTQNYMLNFSIDSAEKLLKKCAEVENKMIEEISKYVRLEKTGWLMKGCCPFHGEKTPSFVVDKSGNNWYCYGCGKGGGIKEFNSLVKEYGTKPLTDAKE